MRNPGGSTGTPCPSIYSGPPNARWPNRQPTFPAAPVEVFLAKENADGEFRLVRSTREIPLPVNLDAIMKSLLAGGTTRTERVEGMVNLVPGQEPYNLERPTADAGGASPANTAGSSDTTSPGPSTPEDGCASVSVGSGGDGITATLEVTPEFFDRFPTESARRLAIGQIVLTITSYLPANGAPPVTRVRFEVNGRVQYVPTADMKLQNMVWATHYDPLRQEPAAVIAQSGTTDDRCSPSSPSTGVAAG